MIPPPRGERGRTTIDGRVGFTKETILSTAGITDKMWSDYIVS